MGLFSRLSTLFFLATDRFTQILLILQCLKANNTSAKLPTPTSALPHTGSSSTTFPTTIPPTTTMAPKPPSTTISDSGGYQTPPPPPPPPGPIKCGNGLLEVAATSCWTEDYGGVRLCVDPIAVPRGPDDRYALLSTAICVLQQLLLLRIFNAISFCVQLCPSNLFCLSTHHSFHYLGKLADKFAEMLKENAQRQVRTRR